jgi:hypothetical protein
MCYVQGAQMEGSLALTALIIRITFRCSFALDTTQEPPSAPLTSFSLPSLRLANLKSSSSPAAPALHRHSSCSLGKACPTGWPHDDTRRSWQDTTNEPSDQRIHHVVALALHGREESSPHKSLGTGAHLMNSRRERSCSTAPLSTTCFTCNRRCHQQPHLRMQDRHLTQQGASMP